MRPGIVTISSYLLIFYAVLALIDTVIALTTLGTYQEIYRDAYAGTDAEGVEGVVVFMVVAMSLVSLLFAAGLVVLALLNNRGMNTARIITWVVGGIALCCNGVGLTFSAAGSAMGGEASDDVVSQEEINRRLEEAVPSWHEPVLMLTAILGIIALLVALILLALPKSNEFFRKPQQQWEPPVPGAAYPMAPGGPAYPTTPGQPGYPQADPSAGSSGQPGYPQADPSAGSSGRSGSSGGDWSSGNSGSPDSSGGGHSGGHG
ncbi:hypothetical protein [Salinispora mooreana]|uniref:hypothetical protein n=1 Tax=Salinispora mooreana TaxID=999545 RepID=UPI00035EF967|nr:hypothetical protein [Salinispora mooreana]